MSDRIDQLREQWDRAVEKDRPADAVKALIELERLEHGEPRWSQRLGEALRRLGKNKEAEEAFVRATERYIAKGFLPRAIAMAKLVISLNPARVDLLAKIEPPKAAPAPPPLPIRPVPLERAKDESRDEVRFADAAVVDASSRSSIDILLEDVDVLEVVDVDVVSDKDPSFIMPEAREPSIDHLGTMATFRLFAGVSRDGLLELSRAAEIVELVPGAMVMMRDEPAYALYAIIDGVVRVIVRGMPSGRPDIRLREGDIIGEGCLLDEGVRQADVRAETPIMALRIDKKKLDEVTARHPEVEGALFELLARRLIMNLMHSSPIFSSFDPKARLELAQLFEVRRAAPGTVLAERGRRSDGLYVLLAGNVTAIGDDGTATRIARGSAFGHASLLGTEAADATVKATTEAVLLRLPAMKFAALAAHYPPVLAILAESAGEPLRASRLPGD
ncbi:MAG: cyclic nucleotide-binding domain-containing protein [Labilithrix sp.]|nr:cyclic nucleotide-binding domain-containing protein [Labilithrix sp.]